MIIHSTPLHSIIILEICCDFTHVSTIEAVIDHFHEADICVGIHGAGLANCVLVRGAKKNKKLIYVLCCVVFVCGVVCDRLPC